MHFQSEEIRNVPPLSPDPISKNLINYPAQFIFFADMWKFSFVIAVCTLIYSCKGNYDAPCRAIHTDPQELNSAEAGLWHFHFQDTLYYSNGNSDTLFLMQTAFGSTYKTFPMPNNPECADDSIGYEIRAALFSDSLNTFAFFTSADKYNAKVTLSINTQNYTWPFSRLSNSDSTDYDSLQFAGRTFMNVFVEKAANGDSVYYTILNGLIRYKSSTAEVNLAKP